MPPRRKGTITTKEIKGTISTEEIGKADDNVSNQDKPLGLTAAAKRQGHKVAISAKEKGGADNVDVPNTEVSIRSSKQKALHKILSMDKEDAGDCMTEATALKAGLGERENDCSGAMANTKHSNRKKQGPRAKKALKSIPEDPEDVVEAEQGSKIVSDEVKEVSTLRANEEKPDRGKSRSARAKENDQCKLRTEEEEEQQGKEPQQEKMTTCRKTTLASGYSTTISPIQAPGNLSNKTTDSHSMPTEKLDPLSALMACTQEPTKPKAKKEHALNVRSSTRAKKVVCYNEESPGNGLNEKKVFVTTELKAQAATKRNASAAKLIPGGAKRVMEDSTSAAEETLAQASTKRNAFAPKLIPGGAKRVKEDPTSAAEETLALDSAKATSVKRGRRRQKLSSPQKLLDKKSAAFRGTGSKEECREHQQESNLEQGNSSSVFFNSMDSLQTAQVEIVKFSIVHNTEIATSPAQEGAKLVSATRLEKASDAGSIMHEKRESGHVSHNQVSEKRSKSQDQTMAGDGESTNLEMSSTAAHKAVLQQHIVSLKVMDEHSIPFNDRKKINASKGRKVNSKRKALPDTAQKAESDLLDAYAPLESDEAAKSKVLKPPPVQWAANSTTDTEPEETYCIHLSVDAEKKLYSESQHGGRNTLARKRTLLGTAQQAKKQKISESNCLDTLPSTASLDMLVEGAAPAQKQEHQKEIQVWNAVDVTNSESRVERSSQKRRREELKRKSSMKFDALPVGFGLGISCWSTPPWAIQSTEEGVIEVVDSSAIQVQSKSAMEEATAQLSLQETAMSKDANNTPLGVEDTHQTLPCSATEMQVSSFSICNSERLPGTGRKPTPKNNSSQRQEKSNVKRQVVRKAKISKALLLESPPAVHTGSDNSMLDKENLEPKLHVDNDGWEFSMRRSSRSRVATAAKVKTTRTKKQ